MTEGKLKQFIQTTLEENFKDPRAGYFEISRETLVSEVITFDEFYKVWTSYARANGYGFNIYEDRERNGWCVLWMRDARDSSLD